MPRRGETNIWTSRRRLATALTVLGVACGGSGGPGGDGNADDLLPIPGGRFVVGDQDGEPDEEPREVEGAPFRIERLEVTNRQFSAFVEATGHVTDPERSGFGHVWDGRWRTMEGAGWRRPRGPATSIANLGDHPVVQISQRDAAAYCAWRGRRLPTGIEWERAARGEDGRRYPWGDDPPRQGPDARANFGTVECCAPSAADGWRTTAPAGAYPRGASPYGVLDMAGNAWEWTASPYPGRPGRVSLRGGGWGNNPYCLRVSYRHANPPDIGLDMVGFRCAADAAR